jgi:hypothetical protein
MTSQPEFLECPAPVDGDGIERCGLPAHVEDRCIVDSTDGPLECATIRCPLGHWFCGALDSLDPRRACRVRSAPISHLVSMSVPFHGCADMTEEP